VTRARLVSVTRPIPPRRGEVDCIALHRIAQHHNPPSVATPNMATK
jgi:hypothetical protein